MKLKDKFRQMALPFYILNIAWKLSPAYLWVTLGIAAVQTLKTLSGIWLTQQLISGLLGGMGREALLLRAALLILAGLIFQGIRRLLAARQEILAVRFQDDFKCYTGQMIMSMDYAFLEDPAVMDLKEQALRPIIDYGILNRLLQEILPGVMNALFLIGSTVVIAVGRFPALLLIVLLSAAVNLCLLGRIRRIKNKTYEVVIPVERRISSYNGLASDHSMGGDIRLYGMDKIIMDKIRHLNRQDLKAVTDQMDRIGRSTGWSGAAFQVQLFAVYGILALLAIRGELGIADYTFYTGIFLSMGSAVFEITDKLSEVFYAGRFFSAFQKFEAIPINEKPAVARAEGTPEIKLEEVAFRYPGTDAPVLKSISLTVRKGEKVALVGKNGAGKSTLVKLLCGLYRPDSGKISAVWPEAGAEGREPWENGLAGLVGAVFQDYRLFAFTLRDNVALGKEAVDIMPLFERVGLEEVISTLPDGENTWLYKLFEEKGIELSGGNGQRLAIARALFRDPPILILDEPTAALDPVAEEGIFRCFEEISQERTALMISHRLSATRLCDRILVLSDGRIAEEGTHSELMEIEGGLYREMYEAQARYYAQTMA